MEAIHDKICLKLDKFQRREQGGGQGDLPCSSVYSVIGEASGQNASSNQPCVDSC